MRWQCLNERDSLLKARVVTAIEKWKSKYENGEKVKSGLGEQIGSWWNSSSPRLRGGKWKSTGNIRKWKLEGERWILKEFIGSPLSGWQMKICCDVWNGAKMRPTSAKLPSVSLDWSGTGGSCLPKSSRPIYAFGNGIIWWSFVFFYFSVFSSVFNTRCWYGNHDTSTLFSE